MAKQTRAALLPSPGDPFVLLHCVEYAKRYWLDKIDKLYINVNSDVELSVRNELYELLKHPKIVLSFTPRTLTHGGSLQIMLDQVDEDNVLLIEDDSIIFSGDLVASNFHKLEKRQKDLVGSQRMSCPPGVATFAKAAWDLDYSGFGDRGPCFYPCFLWARKMALKDCPLGASMFGDTFTMASLILRAKIPQNKIEYIQQNHCTPDDIEYAKKGLAMFNMDTPYMHFGSLSSGIENTLLDRMGKPLKERTKNVPRVTLKEPATEQEKIELEKRVIWWQKAYELNKGRFGEFGIEYGGAIGRVISECKLDEERINTYRKLYESVIGEALVI